MFVAVFEGELGDAGFVELPRPSVIMRVVLFLCGACQRQIETRIVCGFERDPVVLGCVRGAEEAAVLVVLHVFSVGFEYARGRCCSEWHQLWKGHQNRGSRFSAGNGRSNLTH